VSRSTSRNGATTLNDLIAPLKRIPRDWKQRDIFEALQAFQKNLSTINDPLTFELVCESAMETLKEKKVGKAGSLVKSARNAAKGGQLAGQPLIPPDPDPWPEPVDGAELAERLLAAFQRYCILPKGVDAALTLWALYTFVYEAFSHNPFLALLSPTPRCGKTRVLEVLECVCQRSLLLSNTRPAGIYRSVDAEHPTMLLDEGDTYKNMDDEYRNIFNSMHTRASAFVTRNEKTSSGAFVPRKFSTYCPLAIGLIGTLPATVLDRGIVIHMKRKRRDEAIAELSDPDREALRYMKRKARRWAADRFASLQSSQVSVPVEIDDRAADIWKPLFTIANDLGGTWPARVTEAALTLSGPEAREENLIQVDLLAGCREAFREADRLPTAKLVSALNQDGEALWQEWHHGEGITSADVARLLRPFGIKPKNIRFATGAVKKGYLQDDFLDAFSRYLPQVPVSEYEHKDVAGVAGHEALSDHLQTHILESS
jgi:hypothetical protein